MKNVLLITIDSLRANFCGFINESINTTSNLNQLAKEALVYTNAFAASSQTLPSFFAMFTGHYPSESPSKSLDPSIFPTIAYRFRHFGYITLGIHSNPFLRRFGKGFDYFYDIYDIAESKKKIGRASKLFGTVIRKIKQSGILSLLETNPRLFYYAYILKEYYFPAYAKADKTREVFEQLYKQTVKRNKYSKPFFFWIHFMDVHHPFYPPREYTSISSYKQVRLNAKWAINLRKIRIHSLPDINKDELRQLKELYKATIRFVDEEIGKIIELLRDEAVYDDTIIIITADHGEGFLEHGILGHQPLLYDELLHVPLLIKNGNLKGKKDSLVSLIDLWKVFKNNFTIPHKNKIFAEINNYVAYRDNRYKLILDRKRGAVELYDLKNDSLEQNNIAPNNKDVVKELLEHLIKHIEITSMNRRKISKIRSLRKKLNELRSIN